MVGWEGRRQEILLLCKQHKGIGPSLRLNTRRLLMSFGSDIALTSKRICEVAHRHDDVGMLPKDPLPLL